MNPLPLNAECFPQAVTAGPGEHAVFIVYHLKKTPATLDAVKDVCANFAALVRSMQNRFPDQEFSAVTGFGAEAWTTLFPERPKPAELVPFREIKGAAHTAIATPGDLFFHIRARKMGLCMELAGILADKLKGVVEPLDETHGFRFHDGRDIIGFVDGTENPAVDDSAYRFAVIGDAEPEFRGGSYAFVQKYLHDMEAWNALSVEEQEKVIGRRKFNDVELSDEEKPANAHNAVANLGDELKIMRANMPFANTAKGEYGTYFIGYASTFSTTRTMLEHMFVGEAAGNTDRLLDFSTPVTGTLFFVPSFALLGELGE